MSILRRFILSMLAGIAATSLCCGVASASGEPANWLNRMGVAVQSSSYQGTVIRIRDGRAEALTVVRTVRDGVIREKIVAQEGNGLEIIRNGNEVHCILPDRQTVLVEEWDNQSTLFSTLPTSEIRFGSEYDVSIVGNERIAGRDTVMLAIRPHDDFRYGHRIWLDTQTSFPLQTQLIGVDGGAIEQMKFANIILNKEIQASALLTSYRTENFTWLRQPQEQVPMEIETRWFSDQLPDGFRAVSTHEEKMAGSDEVVTHILLSDGLANVSVFIAANSGEMMAGPARVGGSNSFAVVRGDYEITAIGEVPGATVELIAKTMREQ
jgi:sigma-E factor negative regulatory protein RseB